MSGFENRRNQKPGRKPDVVIDPGRQTLHRLLDEVLDRRPDLQPKLLELLATGLEKLAEPNVAVALRGFTILKQALDAVAEHRAATRP